MNCAPERIAMRAVSGSRTVPAPSRISPEQFLARCSITPLAPGTVKVISSAATPPSAQASATRVAWSALSALITATNPDATIFRTTSIFVIDISLTTIGIRNARLGLRAKGMNLRVEDRSTLKLRAQPQRPRDRTQNFWIFFRPIIRRRFGCSAGRALEPSAFSLATRLSSERERAVAGQPFRSANRDRPPFSRAGEARGPSEQFVRARRSLRQSRAPSMRLARNFVAATTRQEVEIRPGVRLHDTLHVKLLVAAFHGIHRGKPFPAPSIQL